MIEIRYSTRLGNQLFQYALARIISFNLNLFLPASPISGFPSTYHSVPGNRIYSPKVTLRGQNPDVNSLLQDSNNCYLTLDGNFQQSRFYIPWARELRNEWLIPEIPSGFTGADSDDLVIHIRRTDYLWQGWGLPFSTYQSIIESHKGGQIVIVTDDPHDPFLWRFNSYKPLIRSTSAFNDFLYLRSANNILMSPSSFSWWAAFLSEASRIYFPIPMTGIWALNHDEGVNLFMHGDERYISVFANEPLSLNLIERLYFERLFWRIKLSNLGFKGYLHSLGTTVLNKIFSHAKSAS